MKEENCKFSASRSAISVCVGKAYSVVVALALVWKCGGRLQALEKCEAIGPQVNCGQQDLESGQSVLALRQHSSVHRSS
jgi:hypothetical protein